MGGAEGWRWPSRTRLAPAMCLQTGPIMGSMLTLQLAVLRLLHHRRSDSATIATERMQASTTCGCSFIRCFATERPDSAAVHRLEHGGELVLGVDVAAGRNCNGAGGAGPRSERMAPVQRASNSGPSMRLHGTGRLRPRLSFGLPLSSHSLSEAPDAISARGPDRQLCFPTS